MRQAKPEIIGLVTTGLSETQGTDIHRCVREFRAAYPVKVCRHQRGGGEHPIRWAALETGYALAVEALLDTLVPDTRHAGRHPKQVTVLAGGHPTPGDLKPCATGSSLWPAAGAGARYWRFAGWPSGRG